MLFSDSNVASHPVASLPTATCPDLFSFFLFFFLKHDIVIVIIITFAIVVCIINIIITFVIIALRLLLLLLLIVIPRSGVLRRGGPGAEACSQAFGAAAEARQETQGPW